MSGAKRKTWQQSAVREALHEAGGFVSAQQLHADLKQSGSVIGLATVYRTLSSLVETDEADTLLSPTGESLYSACEIVGHHHHIICRSCGKAEEIASDLIEEWSKRVASEHGFTDPTHEIDIFGICANCRLG